MHIWTPTEVMIVTGSLLLSSFPQSHHRHCHCPSLVGGLRPACVLGILTHIGNTLSIGIIADVRSGSEQSGPGTDRDRSDLCNLNPSASSLSIDTQVLSSGGHSNSESKHDSGTSSSVVSGPLTP